LGAGFGGIGAAKQLKKSDVDVVLVDGHDYHTFQPLLYQVATGLLEQPAVGHPIRDLFDKQDNVRVHQDRVTEIDLEAATLDRTPSVTTKLTVLLIAGASLTEANETDRSADW
jgi:NADH dehydrogenase